MDALSPRQQEGCWGRTTREASAPTNCLEVQWRFLQHKNPKPPQFGTTSRKPVAIDPLAPHVHATASGSTNPSRQDVASRGSPSRLFHMFETQELEPNQVNPVQDAAPQESNLSESPRTSRTLNDLMGETQRQAMLNRILADMEYLAVEPTYSRLGQPGHSDSRKSISPRPVQRARSHKPSILQTILQSETTLPKARTTQRKQRRFTALWAMGSQEAGSDDDDDDDDSFDGMSGQPDCEDRDAEKDNDRKRRQRRKLQQHNAADEDLRIFWQQTAGARSAADVPMRLLTQAPPRPQRQKSVAILMGRRVRTPRPIEKNEPRDSKRAAIAQPDLSSQQQDAASSRSSENSVAPRRRRRHIPAADRSPVRRTGVSVPASPPKAHYGAWYVPHTEWWPLHQIEQQTIADKFPDVILPNKHHSDDPHCHGDSTSPLQRQHKPLLPPAALSPRSIEALSPASKASIQTPWPPLSSTTTTGGRMPSSASSRQGAASASPGNSLELQVAGIPQSYIGREYRSFILSTGSTMPQYLQ